MSNTHPLFRFAVITDSHLNPAGAENTSPWRTNRLANDRNRFLVEELNRLEPAFVMHLGDIVHPLPSHAAFAPTADFAKRLFGGLNSPFHLLPGNHDVGDKPLDWMPADCISEETLAIYRAAFGKDWDAFEHDGCHFVRINSSLLNSGLAAEEEQREWLEAELARAKGRVFLFSHYPAFLLRADEDSHYDNLDDPGRSWLLDQLARHKVEALFAGHVHNFFYNRIGPTHCYVLTSITSLRQDYSEFFRIEPAEEFGRNDTAKLGFFMVDVYADRHVARFVRTGGRTGTDGATASSDAHAHVPSPLGVHLRHAWAEETEIPFNAPLDELSRKRVRNDYGLLAMWDLGIVKFRVPLSDLRNERVCRRMIELTDLGQSFTVFSFGLPDTATLNLMRANRALVHRWEIVLPLHHMEAAIAAVRGDVGNGLPPIVFSKLRGHAEANADHSKPFDHSVSLGFDRGEGDELADVWRRSSAASAFHGAVFKIDPDQEIATSLQTIAVLGERLSLAPTVFVKLGPTRSAENPPTEATVAERVAEAALAAWHLPCVDVFLDTFQTIDRGYFLRPGLVDRRFNPNLVGEAYRDIQRLLLPLKPKGELRALNEERGRGIAFGSDRGNGVLWLAGSDESEVSPPRIEFL